MRRSKILAAVFLVSLISAACGNSNDDASGLTGSVAADGSSTVFPVTQAVAEEFSAQAPNVNVSVGTSGTGGGFEKFCNGETDISDASREIVDDEVQACADNGVEYLQLQVAIDGLSVVVNPSNDWTKCLTTKELGTIWGPDSQVDNWRQIEDGFPDRELKLYGPGTDSGTFDYFTEAINGEEGASRSDYVASEDDNVLVQGIAGDTNALGYFGYAYYVQNTDKLKTVAIDGGSGCVQPSDETIASGEYAPLSRPLFIYVSKGAAQREEVREFIDFYLAEMSGLSADVGYLPIPDETASQQVADWEDFTV